MLNTAHLTPFAALLLTSQLHNAQQLSGWCLHFVSSNYAVFEGKEEFSLITGDNLAYVNEHRWPPLSYYHAVEEYRKTHGEELGEKEEEVGEGEEEDEVKKEKGDGTRGGEAALSQRSRKGISGRSRRDAAKCKIM